MKLLTMKFSLLKHKGNFSTLSLDTRSRDIIGSIVNEIQQCFSTAGPQPGTGLQEILLELITNLNVILYLSTCHTIHISVLILFMIMP